MGEEYVSHERESTVVREGICTTGEWERTEGVGTVYLRQEREIIDWLGTDSVRQERDHRLRGDGLCKTAERS